MGTGLLLGVLSIISVLLALRSGCGVRPAAANNVRHRCSMPSSSSHVEVQAVAHLPGHPSPLPTIRRERPAVHAVCCRWMA